MNLSITQKRKINYILVFLLLVCTVAARGQSYFSTKGTDFWFGFMQNYMGDPSANGTDQMKVYVTTDNQTASGVISVPTGGWSQNFVVKPNSTSEIILPTAVSMCTESETIENKGVHIISDIPVSAYLLNYVKQTSDAAIIIPTASLGTNYRAMTYSATDGDFETSQLLIVAAYNNTVIKITPKCATVGPGGIQGHQANSTFSITLNQGEVYQLKGNYTAPTDLTGSLIELDTNASDNCKKFAVFSGNYCARVPDGSGVCCCNALVEEMMPIKTWGTKYITIPLKTRSSDIFRITAAQNNTFITWDGSLPIGLNAGDFYEYSSGTATYVQSNKPVSVAQFSKSSSADGNVNSDPFMIMLQPLDQSIGKIVFNSFSSTIINNYYLNVVTRSLYTGLLYLDNKAIPPAAFIKVPFNPAYSYARLDLTQGNHSLQSDSGYTANIYGYGPYETYGYIAGATFIDPETGFSVIDLSNNISKKYYNFYDTICKGINLKFTAFPNPLITDNYWKFGDNSLVIHGQTVLHSYTEAGDYLLTYYYQRNSICGLDSITWYIHIKCCNPLPGIKATTPVCIGLTANIADTSTFNPNAVYKWDFSHGKTTTGSGQGPYQVNWSIVGTDTIWVYSSEPKCNTDSAYFIITITPFPTSSFKVNSPLCAKQRSTVIYLGNASSDALYQWDFNEGNIISGSGEGPYKVSWQDAGTYNVKLTVSEGGCTSSPFNFPVLVNPSPVADFTADPKSSSTDKPLITFTDNSVNAKSWSWNFGDTNCKETDCNVSALQSPTHAYNSEGEYTVWLVVTSPDNCIDSASTVIDIIDQHTFFVPNAFTPETGGENSVFKPVGTDLNSYEMFIYDRWGAKIFESTTENQNWDGKFNGSEVPAGVYVWQIKYTTKKGVSKKEWGSVTLLR